MPVAGDGMAVLASKQEAAETRLAYVQLCTGHRPSTAFSRLDLPKGRNLLNRLLLTHYLLWFAWVLLPFCFFSSRRANLALTLLSFAENAQLLWLVRKSQVREIILFDIYENDSNVMAILLQGRGVVVNKNTSDVPVCMINRAIVADVVSCCQKFQEAEVKALAHTMRVGKVQTWLPENYSGIAPRYQIPADYDSVPPKTVGYYSSGSWIRQREGYPDLGDGFYQVEPQLKKWLRESFLERASQGIRLIVFPHPNEKKAPQDYADAQAHYADLFDGVPFELRPVGSSTLSEFHHCDVAVSVYSTVSFERLYMGFKSLIFPYQMSYIPEGTPLAKIAPANQEALFAALDQALSESREEFFRHVGLADGTVETHHA
jgi:hypothetical protein